ncbi:MAG: NAD(P)-dependent oxidoreductase [Sphingomonadales bacterium]|nr:MAG: NAD(P)-dependent oxidoreductase [Sphingomonadales bacterium]
MIALVGLGEMGMAVAERLIAAGHPLAIHPRGPKHLAWASERGVAIKSSVIDAVRDARFVIICLFNDQQVREVIDDRFLAALPADATIILHTTGRPDTAIGIGHRGAIIDAPFSGTARDIAAGTVTLLVGGEEATLERCRPVLEAYADPILHTGPLGAGQQVKLVNNLLFAAHVRLARDAARLLDGKLGPLLQCSGASRAIELMCPVGAETFAAHAERFIRKDVAVCLDVAASAGIDTGELGRVAGLEN